MVTTSSSTTVSVVICTFQREGPLCKTIASLLRQSYRHYELIVVDQTRQHSATTRDCLCRLESTGAIQWYRLDTPSLPVARNVGVQRARGDIVLFVDDDTDASYGLVAAHAAEYADPAVGGVAGRRTYPSDFPGLEDPYPVGSIKRNSEHISNFSSNERCSAVEWASGCNMSFRRDLVARAGFFEPTFRGSAVYEDVDFCFRLRRLGYRIVFSPEALLVHLLENDGGCKNRQRDASYYFGLIHNSLLFAQRNMSPRYWPRVLLHTLGTTLALVKQTRSPTFLAVFLAACGTSVVSHARSRHSLVGSLEHGSPVAERDGV